MQTPLDEFSSENSEESYERGVFLQPSGDALKSFSLRDYLTVLACSRKNFSRAKLKSILDLKAKKENWGDLEYNQLNF
jgi:hypothetical protein